ncbi:hypothetical protein KCU83_g869, partial [Aureobasidium melanogenum]
MPTRYNTTPPWGKKRKREPSTSSNSTNQSAAPPSPPPLEAQDSRSLSMEDYDPRRRPTPWAKHSDPLSPSSLASDHDDLQQAAKDMFDWTRSDRPIEESLAHMERIVGICQDEASWSGEKRWKQVIVAYKSCGASADAVQDLKDARESLWNQCRVKHASATTATPRALADSIRTMLAESERSNGHYLDREIKDSLIMAVERVFPRTQPRILIPDSPERPVYHLDQRQVSVAPVAQMLKIDRPSSHQTSIQAAPQQAAAVPARHYIKPPESISALALPILEPSQVIKPKRPSRFAPEAHVQHTIPPSPSASPRPPAAPIQFNIVTGLNQAPLKRPRLDFDIDLPHKRSNNVFSTLLSPERRRSSSALNSNIQPPTGPRSLPLFQAKIVVPQEPLMNQARQKQCILEACDYNNIPAQDATPCSSEIGTWILHFRHLTDLQISLGKMTILHDMTIPVLTYAPGQFFQVFGIMAKSSFITSKVESDIINTVARTFRPARFVLHRQKIYNARSARKWLVIFEQPLDRDNFTLDLKINGFRETLDFFGLACSQEMDRCWTAASRQPIPLKHSAAEMR